ncbi:MAG: hypothetical protein AB7R89_24680 [Dehalococcoidia bacterium]
MKTKKAPTFDDVVQSALKLSPMDKVRLIERLASVLKYDLPEASRMPLKSGYGILAKYGPAPSEEDIAEARREMWANFPREDIA